MTGTYIPGQRVQYAETDTLRNMTRQLLAASAAAFPNAIRDYAEVRAMASAVGFLIERRCEMKFSLDVFNRVVADVHAIGVQLKQCV